MSGRGEEGSAPEPDGRSAAAGGGAGDPGRDDGSGPYGAPPARDDVGAAVWVTGALMLVLGAVTTALLLQDFRSRSYLYLAFYSIPSNAAVSVFPHEPVLLYFGKFADVWIGAAAATAGTLVAGVMDHTVFVPLLQLRSLRGYRENRVYRKAMDLYRRWPFLMLVVAGFSPLPFFPFKFLSFSDAYPMERYLAAIALARFPRYVLLLWAGAIFDLPTWVLAVFFVAVLVLYAWRGAPEVLRRLRDAWRGRSGRG